MGHWLIVAHFSNHPKAKTSIKLYQIYDSKIIIVRPERRLRLPGSVFPLRMARERKRCKAAACILKYFNICSWDAEIIGDCHRKNTVKDNNGSAYPECNKTGEWKSVKHNRQMINRRANEIRKLQREFAKRVASASKKRAQKRVKK